MPEEEYLRPEDIHAERARQVLDFLNAAQTAEEIAAAVEIPDERDVGVRLAQRILDRRRQLGGFTNIQQIADIPLIGPERFTEIVITLSEAQPPEVSVPSSEILREIRALREQVNALQATIGGRSRIVLRALQEQPFLGQAVNLVVTVTEAGGDRPRIDAPLTLTTTWGRLRATDGLTLREGNSVTTRTDGYGTARVLLLPPSSEDLLPVQQDTLEIALRLLDPGAVTPRAIESGLREIAQQYRWDGNPQLRHAIDVYYRDFGEGLLETVNDRDYLLAWSYFDSTVLAYVQDDAESGSGATAVHATAAISLRFKNWLGPWLEVMQTVAQTESRLAEDLIEAKEAEETGTLLGHVYSRVRDFVSEQRGLVGDYVGRRVAEESLRDFLQTETGDLPQETQLTIFPALDVASHTIASSDANVLAAVDQTHSDLRQELNQKIGEVETETVNMLTTHVEGLQEQLDGKVDEHAFSGLRIQVNNELATKVDATAFNTALAGKVDESDFNSLQTDVNNELATKVDAATFDAALAEKVDATAFTNQLGQLDAKIAGVVTERIDVLARSVEELGTRITEVETESIDVLAERVENIQSQLDGKVDVVTFNDALETKVDTAEFTGFKTEVNNELTTKVDAATFDGALARKVDATTFNTALDRKVDSATFAARLSSLRGDVNSLQGNVNRLSGEVFPS